jgi:hypothetical protein
MKSMFPNRIVHFIGNILYIDARDVYSLKIRILQLDHLVNPQGMYECEYFLQQLASDEYVTHQLLDNCLLVLPPLFALLL